MSKTALRNVAAEAGDMQHKLAGVIWYWLQANRTAEAARRESMLDRASYDSFPASDPIAPAALCDPENEAQEVECVIDADRLTLRCVPQGATKADHAAREPELEFESERPDGGRLHVRVHVCAVPSAQNAVDQSDATMPDRPVHAGPVSGG